MSIINHWKIHGFAHRALWLTCSHISDNATPNQKNDFLKDINLMKAVGLHKNIVSLIGFCTKSTPNFLTLEFAAKGDLLTYLRERRKKVKGQAYTKLQDACHTWTQLNDPVLHEFSQLSG